LIGGIGSGKSTAAGILRERGAYVIDADEQGHRVLREPAVRDEIVAQFGTAIVSASRSRIDGLPEIDRRLLASIVFNDPAARRALEAIVHPRMRADFVSEIAVCARQGRCRLIVLDAAILLEAHWNDLCDLVVFIEAPADVRLERVASQRGLSKSAVESRERAQWSCTEKRRRADVVVVNDKGLDELRAEVSWLLELLETWPPRGLDRPIARRGPGVATRSLPGHDTTCLPGCSGVRPAPHRAFLPA
jgi:dephospho-CoA kinase